jgi:hypothetical protein
MHALIMRSFLVLIVRAWRFLKPVMVVYTSEISA